MAVTVPSGILRHRVTIQRPVATVDSYGHTTTADSGASSTGFTTVASGWWASIEPLRGSEQAAHLAMQSRTTHKIRLRDGSELAGIDSTWRILVGARVFYIDSVMNSMERKREWQIMAHEVENRTA